MQGKHAALIATAIGIAFAVPQNAHADWLSAITRQAIKQGQKHIADQATERAASGDGQRTFGGYSCSDDCSGHRAGYEWAKRKGIFDYKGCESKSRSFTEGCRVFIETPPTTREDKARQRIVKAAREILSVFRKAGVQGTAVHVENCYKKSPYDPYCLYMDAAGRHLDYMGTLIFGTDYSNYYSDRSILERSARFAKHYGMGMKKMNKYIKIIYTSVSKVIDAEI